MKNLIKPISQLMETESADSTLQSTLEALIKQFKSQVDKGKIKINSVTDFNKLVNAYLLLDANKKANGTTKKEDYHLRDLIDEEDTTIKELYDKLFESYNNNNDEINKEN